MGTVRRTRYRSLAAPLLVLVWALSTVNPFREARTEVQADTTIHLAIARDCVDANACPLRLGPYDRVSILGISHASLQSLTNAAALIVGGDLGFVTLLNSLLAALAALILFRIARGAWEPFAAAVASAGFVELWDRVWNLSAISNPSLLVLPSAAFALAWYVHARSRDHASVLAMGLGAGCAFLAHASGLFLVLGALPFVVGGARRGRRAAAAALLVLPLVVLTGLVSSGVVRGLAVPGVILDLGALALVAIAVGGVGALVAVAVLARRVGPDVTGWVSILAPFALAVALTGNSWYLVPYVPMGLVTVVQVLERRTLRAAQSATPGALPWPALRAAIGRIPRAAWVVAIVIVVALKAASLMVSVASFAWPDLVSPRSRKVSYPDIERLAERLHGAGRDSWDLPTDVHGGCSLLWLQQALAAEMPTSRPAAPSLSEASQVLVLPAPRDFPVPPGWAGVGDGERGQLLVNEYEAALAWREARACRWIPGPSGDRWSCRPLCRDLRQRLFADSEQDRRMPRVQSSAIFFRDVGSETSIVVRVPVRMGPSLGARRIVALHAEPTYGDCIDAAILEVRGVTFEGALPGREVTLTAEGAQQTGEIVIGLAWCRGFERNVELYAPVLELSAGDPQVAALGCCDPERADCGREPLSPIHRTTAEVLQRPAPWQDDAPAPGPYEEEPVVSTAVAMGSWGSVFLVLAGSIGLGLSGLRRLRAKRPGGS